MKRWLLILLPALFLTACEYKEEEREIGYKGKARINPWLAVERYATHTGRQVQPVIAWTPPESKDAVWIIPASILGNESYTRRMESWVKSRGHLILLVEHADSETNDWSGYAMPPDLKPALFSMLERAGIKLDKIGASGETTADTIKFEEEEYKVNAKSVATVATKNEKAGVFASRAVGNGKISVITDGRIFRNRWISDNEHAELLQALIDATDNGGRIGIMRGSGLSLWGLIVEYLPHVLLGLGVWMLLWLWKNLSRFGPIEPATAPPVLRGYEHHLEALGDFQWRLDHGAALLAPLRGQIVEIGQRTSVRSGCRDDDFFQFLADRAGLTRERVFRALAEQKPADAAILTRTTVDLQQLLKVLNPNPQS
ncbi:MAG: DUF4350 domain-containing protein [Verrucomicrobiota bacterium]